MILSPPLWASGSWVDDSWADGTWATTVPEVIAATAYAKVIVPARARRVVVPDEIVVVR